LIIKQQFTGKRSKVSKIPHENNKEVVHTLSITVTARENNN
jgi:hypothetical protein